MPADPTDPLVLVRIPKAHAKLMESMNVGQAGLTMDDAPILRAHYRALAAAYAAAVPMEQAVERMAIAIYANMTGHPDAEGRTPEAQWAYVLAEDAKQNIDWAGHVRSVARAALAALFPVPSEETTNGG